MTVQNTQEIEWIEYFDHEIARNPEFDELLVEAIRTELQYKDRQLKPPPCADDRQHQSLMYAEAKKAIDGALNTSRSRLALMRHDELQLGLLPKKLFAPIAQHGAAFDELDDLLDDHQTVESGTTNAHSLIEVENQEGNCREPVVAAISPATSLITYYEFPDTALFEPDYDHLDDSALRQALQGLVMEQMPYHVIRDRYTAIASVMNRRGTCPPKFRPQRSLPRRKKDATDDKELMMRDRQVIDMHWLHCRGKRDNVPGKEFAGIFADDELDFYLAGQLASKGWSHEIKAEKSLNLIPHEQLPLAILRSKSIADAWSNAERTMVTTIEKRLREQAVVTPSLKPHIEDFKHLWLAEKIIGKGKGRLRLIAQMHAWITGKAPLATSTLSEKLKRMRIRTGSNTGRIKGASGAGSRPENS